MKILLVSHSYVVRENFKNVAALARYARVRAVMPDRFAGMFGATEDTEVHDCDGAVVYGRIVLPRGQFFLKTRDMGMRSEPPDIINVEYDPWSAIFWQTALYRRLFAPKARLVCTVKKNTYRRARWPFQMIKDLLFRLTAPSVACFIAVNRGVARIYHEHLGIPADRIVTLPHLATDTDLFRPAATHRAAAPAAPDSPFVIGFAGRLAEHKGVLDLIAACGALHAERVPLRLKLLGDGPLRDELAALGHDWLELSPPVPHHEVVGFLHGLDLFVMPARITPDHEEHDGHAVMEALSCGVPCLGSSSGVLPELVSADLGYMFKANDRADLTQKLRAIIAAPKRHAALAATDRARAVAQFSLDRVARDRISLYESLLS